MSIYITADLHLGHEKVALARGFTSVEEHDNTIIANINNMVTKRDCLYILGDVAFKRTSLELLVTIPCVKKLILGNHDRYNIELYSKYFSQIFGAIRLKGCILTHIPVATSEFPRYRLNIHGHLHSRTIPDNRYRCVSLEQNTLRPFKLADLTKLE